MPPATTSAISPRHHQYQRRYQPAPVPASLPARHRTVLASRPTPPPTPTHASYGFMVPQGHPLYETFKKSMTTVNLQPTLRLELDEKW